MSAYMKRRQKNIEDNNRMLAELGLTPPQPCQKKLNGAIDAEKRTKSTRPKITSQVSHIEGRRVVTRSHLRSSGEHLVAGDELAQKGNRAPLVKKTVIGNMFGSIPGISVGQHFDTRLECSHAGVHRATVAGIHGSTTEGAYSLALSGGYEDDVDNGDSFVYTGSGGRDLRGTKCNPKNLRTAPQSKDQQLEKGNLALSISARTGRPLRVIRGYQLKSSYAPENGYRYDGLYKVMDYWSEKGASGFQVYKFGLQRIDEELPPWAEEKVSQNEDPVSPKNP